MTKVARVAETLLRLCQLGRPFYVLPVAVCGLVGYLVAAGPAAPWWPGTSAALGLFALGMAAWTGNEIADRGKDGTNRTKRRWGLYVAGGTDIMNCGGAISPFLAVTALCVLVAIGLGLLSLVSATVLVCGTVFLLCGLLYSFVPTRLKGRGLIGAAVVATASGALPFFTGWVASGTPFKIDGMAPAVLLSLLFLGGDCIAHVLDHSADRAAGDRTVAVALGASNTLELARLLIGVPLLLLALLTLWRGQPHVFTSVFAIIAALGTATAILWLTRRPSDESNLCAARVLSVPAICIGALILVLV